MAKIRPTREPLSCAGCPSTVTPGTPQAAGWHTLLDATDPGMVWLSLCPECWADWGRWLELRRALAGEPVGKGA